MSGRTAVISCRKPSTGDCRRAKPSGASRIFQSGRLYGDGGQPRVVIAPRHQHARHLFLPSWTGIYNVPFFFFVHHFTKLRCSSVTGKPGSEENLCLKPLYRMCFYNTPIIVKAILSYQCQYYLRRFLNNFLI